MEKHKQRMFFMHPCILDSKCEGCPSVAKCVADVPYAVPKPGYCRRSGPSAAALSNWLYGAPLFHLLTRSDMQKRTYVHCNCKGYLCKAPQSLQI